MSESSVAPSNNSRSQSVSVESLRSNDSRATQPSPRRRNTTKLDATSPVHPSPSVESPSPPSPPPPPQPDDSSSRQSLRDTIPPSSDSPPPHNSPPPHDSPHVDSSCSHLSADRATSLVSCSGGSVLVLCLLVVMGLLAYMTLQVFIRPLLWALLCGTILFPMKCGITKKCRKWIRRRQPQKFCLRQSNTNMNKEDNNDNENTDSQNSEKEGARTIEAQLTIAKSLLVGVVSLPFNLFDVIGDFLYAKSLMLIAIGALIQITYLFYYYTPYESIAVSLWTILKTLYYFCDNLACNWLFTMILVYASTIGLFWYHGSPLRGYALHASPLLWFLALMRVTDSLGDPMKSLIVTASLVCSVYAYIYDSSPVLHSEKDISSTANDPKTSGGGKQSDIYLQTLMCVCAVVIVWSSSFCLAFTPFILTYLLLKYIGNVVYKFLTSSDITTNEMPLSVTSLWKSDIALAIIPSPIRSLGHLALRVDYKLMNIISDLMDEIVTIFLIFILICSLITATVFFTIQVQNESVYITSMVTNIVNDTEHPVIKQWMPDNKMLANTMNSVLDNGYQYSREWISSKIKQATEHVEDSLELEEQVLQFYDFFYKKCFSKNTTVESIKPTSMLDITGMWFKLNKTPSFDIVYFAKENIGVVMKLLDSIWRVVVSNINILTNLLYTGLTIIHVGGMVVLNFLISGVIFLTTLYYLLSSSNQRYLPLECISAYSLPAHAVAVGTPHADKPPPTTKTPRVPPSQSPSSSRPVTRTQKCVYHFSISLEEAISSILLVTLKIAFFHGLYTWLTHTLFSVHIVFLPSALAAILAAVPFLGTYWAAMPAVVELWLIQGRGMAAVAMAIVSLLPTFTVTSSLLSDIKGGHPYLSGLAIAGGVYWLGLEGAIVGPIALCILIATSSMYTEMIKEN